MGHKRNWFMPRWLRVDFVDMRRWILFIIALSLSVLGPAQERTAIVRLEDGTEVSGRVVRMDLKQLQLVVGEEIVTIQAADIKTCRFEQVAPAGEQPEGGGQPTPEGEPEAGRQTPRVVTAGAPGVSPTPPGGVALPVRQLQPTSAAATATGAGSGTPPQAAVTGTAKVAAAQVVTEGEEPSGWEAAGRPATRLKSRVRAIEEVYPWLRPVDPVQWLSLGLLLFSALSLIVHISVVVAGAENASFGRSLGLAVLYLVGGFGQFALVPGNDLGVFSMLIGNTALVLFALSGLYGLARSSAFVAFAVQIGCVVVGFGILQLIDSLLGSVGAV